jgi:hypothetical protein
MPVVIKGPPPTEALPVAETEEFKDLLKQIEQAKSVLNQLGSQIVAIEAKMKPNTNKGAYLPAASSTSVEEAKYQESIAEMQRIAGLR